MVRMLELLCVIEDLGVVLDKRALAEGRTVCDAFSHYVQNA